MTRFLGMTLLALAALVGGSARAGEAEAKAVVDKALKALGGEEKLSKVKAFSSKVKATITFNGSDNELSGTTTIQGLDRLRSEFEGDFGGNTVRVLTVLNGDKSWRKFGDDVMELDGDAVTNEKRTVYLQVVPTLVTPLKDKGYKLDTAPEEKVGDKPAAVVKVTPPDGKEFTLYFDKETGLPVKEVAKVVGFQGEEFTQETTYEDYKEFDGIKKATKLKSKRDGSSFLSSELLEFKVLDKVDADTFAEPK